MSYHAHKDLSFLLSLLCWDKMLPVVIEKNHLREVVAAVVDQRRVDYDNASHHDRLGSFLKPPDETRKTKRQHH